MRIRGENKMRKKIVVCVIAALCLFVSASPWEGAAAVAPEGELPGNGRYIATNSFPRNTVVDIVNIETNKSTRVIVARSLDSPGLLAIVSREAAELIGMRPGSVSRIRMTQPSDPVAYVRFTESLASGIPDYDSGDVITEERYVEEFVNPSTPPGSVAVVPPAVPPAPPAFAAAPDTGYPAYVLEPEWSGAKSNTGSIAGSARDIIDLPPIYIPSEKKPEIVPSVLPVKIAETETGKEEEKEEVAEVSDVSGKIAETEPEDTEITDEIPEKLADAETEESEEDELNEDAGKIAETEPADEVKTEETPEKTAEVFPEDDSEAVAVYVPDDEYFEGDFPEERETIAGEEDEHKDDTEKPSVAAGYNMVPADERPPSSVYGLDPALIISGITNGSKSETVKPETSYSETSYPKASYPETPVKTNTFDSEYNFSAQRITKLESGYYVQLASFDSAESVQSGISRIEQRYEPKVYKDGDKWYRILLGPLNQGESAAILARFKSIGYKDAFVRVAR
jgi:hypothetical protein